MSEYIYPTCKITKEEFNHRHWENEESLNSIAKSLGIFSATLRFHAIHKGLKTRSPEASHKLAIKTGQRRTYTANYSLFENWSKEMAWALGLMASDGNVNQEVNRISFSTMDIELAEKFRNVLEYTENIKKRKTTNVYTVRIYSSKLAHDLVSLGITPAKSLTLEMPNIPQEFLPDFVRGVFDGDGCVSVIDRTRHHRITRLVTSITSASEKFAIELSNQLIKAGLTSSIHSKPPKGVRHTQYIVYLGAHHAIDFYHFLYSDAPRELCLLRKRELFEQYIEQFGNLYANGRLKPGHAPWEKIPCKFEGCNKPAKSLGYCQTHYMQIYRERKYGKQLPKPPLPTCSIDGCTRIARTYKSGICEAHYRRFQREIKRAHPVTKAPTVESVGRQKVMSKAPVTVQGS
jgi:intein-encoded DNA endonuclease-like protein